MTRMAAPDCADMCNLINAHTHAHTHDRRKMGRWKKGRQTDIFCTSKCVKLALRFGHEKTRKATKGPALCKPREQNKNNALSVLYRGRRRLLLRCVINPTLALDEWMLRRYSTAWHIIFARYSNLHTAYVPPRLVRSYRPWAATPLSRQNLRASRVPLT